MRVGALIREESLLPSSTDHTRILHVGCEERRRNSRNNKTLRVQGLTRLVRGHLSVHTYLCTVCTILRGALRTHSTKIADSRTTSTPFFAYPLSFNRGLRSTGSHHGRHFTSVRLISTPSSCCCPEFNSQDLSIPSRPQSDALLGSTGPADPPEP